MPTEELRQLLERGFSRTAIRPLAELTSPLLREVVNDGLWVFRRCEAEAATAGNENVDLPTLAIYRHIIEMTDGVQVLLEESCGTAAVPLLRSSFEGSLSLSYLLESADDYTERSLSWLCSFLHTGMKARNQLNATTPLGKAYRAAYAQEFGRVVPGVQDAKLTQEVQNLRQVLQGPQFAPIEAEYQRTKGKLRRTPEWFSLFNGPRNRAQLAELLNRAAEYRFLYGDWSSLSHGNDLRRYMSAAGADGTAEHDAVRRPDEVKEIAILATLFLVHARAQMVAKFRPGENQEGWYVREVRPLLNELRTLEIIFQRQPEEPN